MNLVLFTSTYPFDGGAEQTFLDPELKHLCREFDSIVLVPKKVLGKCLPLPEGVVVDESYAVLLQNANLFTLAARIFTSRLLYHELFSHVSLLLHPSVWVRAIRFLTVATLTFDWTMKWLKQKHQHNQDVFYSYWFDSSSFGIGLTKEKFPDIKLVSRVHGYDLYEEPYYDPPYWPFRRAALTYVDGLFPDSNAGLQYLTERYPEYSGKYETALLGVEEPGFITSPSTDNIFRIVSCSMLVPLKRVDLLLEGVLCAARMRPYQQFEWTHKGNGNARTELQEKANQLFPKNARAYFPGYSVKAELMQFYRGQPADVFFNVSTTEGTPVSIMEAASCGIPVVATAVGGNKEIVSEENGILLGDNPPPEEIAQAILELLDNPERTADRRQGSRAVWMERYNADLNFKLFAERLRTIREST